MSTESKLADKRMAVWEAFLRIHTTIIPRLECEMREVQDLPLVWFNVLRHLSRDSHGGLRLQELAEAIGLSQSGLTRLLDRMGEAGLVAREPCPDDRRGAYAVITPEGHAALEQAAPIYRRGIEAHFLRHLSDEDVAALYKAFCRVLAGGAADSL